MNLNELPDDIKTQILQHNESSLCAASKATLAECDRLWRLAVAAEKHYWENIYKVGDVVGVPEDNVRQDMRRYDKRRKGFERILDLIRRRDGVELDENQISKDVSLRVAFLTLIEARNWAPRHWRPGRQHFTDLLEFQTAFCQFEKGGDLRQEAVARYGEPEAWIITNLTSIMTPDNEFVEHWFLQQPNQNANYPGPDFNEPIGAWDTSSVTRMTQTFRDFRKFNKPIGAWDTSKVTHMNEMFMTALSFDQPIGDWNTGEVRTMQDMFHFAINFNQPIGKWKTGKVTDMGGMFMNAERFNQPIGGWDTSIVNNISNMFCNATAFNQPIGGWDTSEVSTMTSTFQSAISFNQPISGWDTSNVWDMERMFQEAEAFDQPLCSWDVSTVQYMTFMFAAATNFNQPLGEWKPYNLDHLDQMFEDSAFDQDIFSMWTLPRVTEDSDEGRSAQYIQTYTDAYRQRHAWRQDHANVAAAPTRPGVVDAVFAFHRISV